MAYNLLTTTGINSLISSYKSSETTKQLTTLTTRKTKYQDMVSKWSTVSSSLTPLKSVLDQLKVTGSSSAFIASKSATSSNTGFVAVSATADAPVGTFSLRVNQLSKNDSVVSETLPSITTNSVTAGVHTLKFQSGDNVANVDVTFGGSETNLTIMQKIRDAVNSDSTASSFMSASVFSPSTAQSKLTFTAKNSGFTNRLRINEGMSEDDALKSIGLTSGVLTNRYKNSDDTKAGFLFGTNLVGVLTEDGTNNLLNSKFQYNGISIQKDSNVVSDVASGLTLTLKAAMQTSDTDVNVAVASDTSGTRTKIDNFISKFNSVYTSVKNQMYSSTIGRGVFTGDPNAQGLLNALYKGATAKVGVPDGNLNSLSQLGISFNTDSGLTVSDSGQLNNSISQKMSQVEAVFNSENGVAARLSTSVNLYEGSSGSVYSAISSYNSNITSISSKVTSVQTRIDKQAEGLRKQYTDLQSRLVSILALQDMFTGAASAASTVIGV
ncbi:MAG: flagellar filament capping protein FliD [Ignavibacteria bacterium]